MGNLKRILIIIATMAAFLPAFGCSDDPASVHFKPPRLEKLAYKGFSIPKFPTPADQLNYARSCFKSMAEKKAALQAVSILFPDARRQSGDAFLTLAYMKLGFDYRFTDPEKSRNAIAAYHKVIEKFKDLPSVLVKAYWYMGWIYCDLLGQDREGVRNYWIVVQKYPNLRIGISPPVPWVSLVYPGQHKNDKTANDKSGKKWASIALLEIIRHTVDDHQAWQAFDLLWKNYRNSVSTGLALKALLKDKKNLKNKILPFVKPYLNLNSANKFLAAEISKSTEGMDL